MGRQARRIFLGLWLSDEEYRRFRKIREALEASVPQVDWTKSTVARYILAEAFKYLQLEEKVQPAPSRTEEQ